MAFSEKPPIMSGNDREDIEKLRDYLFRMAQSLNDTLTADTSVQTAVSVSTRGDGQQVIRTGPGAATDIEAVRKNAQELKSLIIKSANNLQRQINDIEHSTFYIKYADDFAGDYPESMYNTPTEDTYYMGVCSSTEETAPTDPAAYSWSRIKGNGGTGLNSATVLLYRRAENPPARPQADLTYTFASGRLDLGPVNVSGHKLRNVSASVSGHKASSTGIEVERHLASVTGWTQEIPDSDGRPCWVITATAIATTATDVISASEWSEPKKLVEDGERGQDGQPGRDGTNGENGRDGRDGRDGTDGSDGANGYNTAIVYLYTRAAAEPARPQEALTYSFPDKSFTTDPTLPWYKTPPAGTDPLYVTAATASSRNDTDVIGAGEWSTPVIMAENGEDGSDGETGSPGLNSATIFLYQRNGTQPSKPTRDLTYTFSTHVIDLTPITGSGWTQTIPQAQGDPCWVTTATAANTGATDVIGTGEWSDVVKLVEDGKDGIDGRDGVDGTNGTNGTNGYNTAIVYLYTRADEAPTITWETAIKYTFSSGKLATVPTGWSQTIPAADGTKKLYVTAASARSRSTSVNIAATAWATPVLLAENGQQGQQGIQGPPGTDGRTTYLHIKYSDDGETFTGNDGEDVGAFIGTLTDYNEADSMTFSDYTWHRFADDEELQAAIQAGDIATQEYCDRKVESLSGLYVAQSEYGTFKEEINTTIETTAKNTIESYGYGASIESLDRRTDSIQKYLTAIDGEIRRGIVEDPNTGDYVTGIAISQNLKFSGECGPTDQHNPGDGYTYYYIDEHQTFGLYTSTGWQFWIDGYRRGWFNSLDNMLHVANVVVENVLQIGSSWQLRSSLDGTEFEILYVGA